MSSPSTPSPKPDPSERGAARDGQPQTSPTRLYMQLQVFGNCMDPLPLRESLKKAGLSSVLYQDLHDPRGVALLTWSENPDHFLGPVRRFLVDSPFAALSRKAPLTMLGRSYALGHEKDLRHWLFERPISTASNGQWPWAIWYPLRRRGSFAQLQEAEQRAILMEHAKIGMAWAEADLAHDIRLACFGLDEHDNDFVIGLVGGELAPLSKLVETMRSTTQTSQYIERLGPFFVGKAMWQSR